MTLLEEPSTSFRLEGQSAHVGDRETGSLPVAVPSGYVGDPPPSEGGGETVKLQSGFFKFLRSDKSPVGIDGASNPAGDLAALASAEKSAPRVQAPRQLPRPGVFEQILVVITLMISYHETPNAWLLTHSDRGDDYSNPLAAVSLLLLLCVGLARVGGSLDHLVAIVKVESTVFLFAVLAFVSVIWSANPSETLRRGLIFVLIAMFGAYLVLRFSLQDIVRLLAIMFVISAIVNLFVVMVYPYAGVSRVGEFSGVFAQKNALGYVSALAIPTLLIASRSSWRGRWVFYPAAGLHVYLLLGSESKTMLVAGFGPVILMVFYTMFRGRRTLPGAVMVALVGSAVLGVAFATANLALLAKWLDKDVTLTGRVPLWEDLIPVVFERPLFGHGYQASFGGFFSPVHEALVQNNWDIADSHNALLQILLDLGAIGTVLFLIAFLRGVVRATKIVAIVPGALGLWPLVFLTTSLSVSVTESGVQSDNLGWMMFVVATLSAGAHLKHRESLGLSNRISDQSRVVSMNETGRVADRRSKLVKQVAITASTSPTAAVPKATASKGKGILADDPKRPSGAVSCADVDLTVSLASTSESLDLAKVDSGMDRAKQAEKPSSPVEKVHSRTP